MSSLLPEQRELAGLLFSLPEAAGYALAGGSALVALRLVERLTRDLDAFKGAQPGVDPGTVEPLLDAFTVACGASGWSVDVVRRHRTFCRALVHRGEQRVEVDLAVDVPPLRDFEIVDGLPVLSPTDLAARKVLAVLDRSEGRDFSDLWALSRVLGRSTCIDAARRLDPGITVGAVAAAFTHIDRLDDEDFPVEDADLSGTRAWFSDWRHALAAEQ